MAQKVLAQKAADFSGLHTAFMFSGNVAGGVVQYFFRKDTVLRRVGLAHSRSRIGINGTPLALENQIHCFLPGDDSSNSDNVERGTDFYV